MRQSSYKITYKVSERDTSVLVHKEVKVGGKLEKVRDCMNMHT